MRSTRSNFLAVAFGLLLLFQASPLRAQDDWRAKFAVVEKLMSEEIPADQAPALAQRWAVIAQNAQQLREAEHAPLDDAFKARLAEVQTAEDQSRRAPSSTISSNRNEGLANWQRADKLVSEWVASGEPITRAHLVEINTALRSTGGTDNVYAGGRNSALAVPDANTDEALDGFMKWLEGAQGTLNPIELAARAYQRLVTIHPLQDANGRTSRLLMDWVLERAGFPAVALDHAVATNAISDPFVFGGTAEQYSGRPLKVIENLTTNLERGVRTKLEALGRTWTTLVDELPLPKNVVDHTTTSSTDAAPKPIVLEASSSDADKAALERATAAREAALAQAPRTGITEVLDRRAHESADADRSGK